MFRSTVIRLCLPLIALFAALLLLPGCDARDLAVSDPDDGTRTSTSVTPSPQPPPSFDEQARVRLASFGAEEVPRGLTLTLSGAQFAPGESDFAPEDVSRIDAVAKLMRQQYRRRILIEGHTDNIGSEAANEQLSLQRAEAVERALIDRGINAGRLHIRGLGESQPAHDNDTEEGRRNNRRVVLIFSDSDGFFALPADESLQT
jgi:outer membrane protein OmpA-like peptidoglycan-associated protein